MLKTAYTHATRKAAILNLEGDGIVSRSLVRFANATVAAKTAYKGTISRDAAGDVDLVAEMAKHPNALWIRVKAIEADIPNDNGDNFPREEILKSYKSFEGVPVFTNHENSKAENAKGKVVKAEWDEKENAVYCTMFVDREACAPLCRAIEEGYITDVSMGTQVDYSTCSVCQRKAFSADNYCFVPGTPILMSDFSIKNIEDIEVGDEVLDAFGLPTKVTKLFSRDISEKIQVITSRFIDGALLVTGNHPLLTKRRNEYRFVHAHDIDDRETLLCPVYQGESSEECFDAIQFEKTEENKAAFARLIGYYAAEGCVSKQHGELYSTEFSFGFSEQEFIADVSAICKNLFGKDPSLFHYPERGNGCSLRVYCPALTRFFNTYVPGRAREKRLASPIVRLPVKYLKEFLAGYVNGDGCTRNGEKLVINTASKNLASQISHILLRLHSSPSTYSYLQPGGPSDRDKRFSAHRITVAGSQLRAIADCGHKLSKFVGLMEKKQEKLKNAFSFDGKYAQHPSRQIAEEQYEGPVHNIETESHSYVANNTAVHNCEHVKTLKGRHVDGKKVFENNYGLKFIELSVVTDGACKSCTVEEILSPEDYITRVAQAVKTIKTHISKQGMEIKNGGQAEIQKLNQAMDLLEDVSRTMLGQREFIDLEFAKNVMEVLADLQHVNDELVDQGYGKQGNQSAEQTDIPPPPESPGVALPTAGEGQQPEVQNMPASEPAPTGVGTITGPAMASPTSTSVVLSARIKDLHTRVAKLYEEQTEKLSSKGGDSSPVVKNERSETVDKNEKASLTVAKLAKIWDPSVKHYEGEIREGEFKVVFTPSEIIGLKGGVKLASASKAGLDDECQALLKDDPRKFAGLLLDGLREKFASYAPTNTPEQQTMTEELQLATQKPPLHPRTNEVRESITEDQLRQKREGYEQHARQEKDRSSITEAQLGKGEVKGYDWHKRQGSDRQDITQLQLRDEGIKGNSNPAGEGVERAAGVTDQQQQIHEGQLEDLRKQDKGFSPEDRITEKQLAQDSENWSRRIASVSNKEEAKAALRCGLKAISKTAAATGAAPEEFVSIINDITASSQNRIAAEKAIDALAPHRDLRAAMLRRASFNGPPKNVTTGEVADYLLGSVGDNGLAGGLGVTVLEQIGLQKDASTKISEAITAGPKSDEEEFMLGEEKLGSRDMLREVLAETDDKEEVKVVLSASDVGNDADADKFAEKAFGLATKQAEASGLTITDNIHVAKRQDGKVEVSMLGVKDAKKKNKKADEAGKTCADCGKAKCSCSASSAIKERKEARREVVAQMGGGLPGAPGGAGNPPDLGGAGGAGAPGMAPAGPAGTTLPAPGAPPEPPGAPGGEAGPGGDEEGTGEALAPGSICPACGSDDVDVKHGEINCNECGMSGDIEVVIRVKEWPGAIEDTEPSEEEGMGEEGPGIGEMAGGPGMEMAPPVGLAASFKVTPEMVKVAGNKPIGSFCPHCGSTNVKLALKSGAGRGKCVDCDGQYAVKMEVGSDKSLKATVAWNDRNSAKFAAAKIEERKVALAAAKELKTRKTALDAALRKSGNLGKFAKADLAGKANIISVMHDEGLL